MAILDYINETKAELRHVSWPTKSQAVNYTILVIVFSLVVAFLLAAFDGIAIFSLKQLLIAR